MNNAHRNNIPIRRAILRIGWSYIRNAHELDYVVRQNLFWFHWRFCFFCSAFSLTWSSACPRKCFSPPRAQKVAEIKAVIMQIESNVGKQTFGCVQIRWINDYTCMTVDVGEIAGIVGNLCCVIAHFGTRCMFRPYRWWWTHGLAQNRRPTFLHTKFLGELYLLSGQSGFRIDKFHFLFSTSLRFFARFDCCIGIRCFEMLGREKSLFGNLTFTFDCSWYASRFLYPVRPSDEWWKIGKFVVL